MLGRYAGKSEQLLLRYAEQSGEPGDETACQRLLQLENPDDRALLEPNPASKTDDVYAAGFEQIEDVPGAKPHLRRVIQLVVLDAEVVTMDGERREPERRLLAA